MKEKWIKIKDWPYEVSNSGMVRRIETGRIKTETFSIGSEYKKMCPLSSDL